MLPVLHNLNYKLQRRQCTVLPIQQSHQQRYNKFSSVAFGELHEDTVCDTLSNVTDQCPKGSSNLLTPYREQPRSTRIVVTYPRPAFSAIKRIYHAPINFDQQAQVYQGLTSYRNKENQNTKVHSGGGLELVKPAHELASNRPKLCASLKKPHESCRFAAPCWPS